jgi:hypothetical protein
MKTIIQTIHEEVQKGDVDRTIGVLYNPCIETKKYETLFYIYRKEIYVFFKTVTDLVNYGLYGEQVDVSRAYVKEEDFDHFYNVSHLDDFFSQKITWGT